MYVYRNIEARSCNHCWNGKAVLHIVTVCVCVCVCVALAIRNEMRMRHIVIVTCPTLRHDFRKKSY